MSTTPRVITTIPTWEDLATREPRLTQLRRVVEQVTAEDGQRFCANEHWYASAGGPNFRGQMMRLVGWLADSADPVIRSSDGYDVAYQTLYGLLPDCWECDCAPRWVA